MHLLGSWNRAQTSANKACPPTYWRPLAALVHAHGEQYLISTQFCFGILAGSWGSHSACTWWYVTHLLSSDCKHHIVGLPSYILLISSTVWGVISLLFSALKNFLTVASCSCSPHKRRAENKFPHLFIIITSQGAPWQLSLTVLVICMSVSVKY